MAVTGACYLPATISPALRRETTLSYGKLKPNWIPKRYAAARTSSRRSGTRSFGNTSCEGAETIQKRSGVDDDEADQGSSEEVNGSDVTRRSLKDYFDEATVMIRPDGGPPRWFSPLECGSRSPDSPLLLYVPGIDGVGLGLVMQLQALGKIFDIWCLHIPVEDRTSFKGLMKIIEITVRSENYRLPKRPIYIVGESLGACLALAVAARNPDIDLALILANPATSFANSRLRAAITSLQLMPDSIPLSISYILSLITGHDPLKMVINNAMKGFSLQSMLEDLPQNLVSLSSYLSVLADILPKETLLWKLELLKSAFAHVNARLEDVKSQTLILASGNDPLLPSQEEGERLRHALPNCRTYTLHLHGHFLFMEDGTDLVTIIKRTGFYRRGNIFDYVSDYIPPTSFEINQFYQNNNRWWNILVSPVMISTLEDGKIVRGLSGIPAEGPIILVGYHMLLGMEVGPLIPQFMKDRNIILRGMAHPVFFVNPKKDGILPDLRLGIVRLLGAIPVSAANLYKLLASKSHILLYPGGAREALHRKGEQYKLFWPEQSEFVRMASMFGAKIIPFGAVGEDDLAQVVFDYNDQMKIPCLKYFSEKATEEAISLRTDATGEVASQQLHCPCFMPQVPGRFYYYFGKPIETQGRKQELRDREKAQALYLQVKSEVEKCIAYLKEKRENDPYRSLLSRLDYQTIHGFESEIPTFEL